MSIPTIVLPTPQQFMARVPKLPNGNTAWAQNYAGELREIIYEHASQAPRTLQLHLGPSELGVVCDRQVAAKMAGVERTNNVFDPWASIVGTALHLWFAECFAADNGRHGLRWLVETRVTPHPDHPGTADLYDAWTRAVVDHKNLGDTTLPKVKSDKGPPRHYVVQLLLYGLGFRKAGLPVDRVVLAAYPRTKSTLTNLYVWEHLWTPADDLLLETVFAQTAIRQILAKAIIAGDIDWMDVPATPDDSGCFYCPYYRPEVSHDNSTTTYGCPGTTGGNRPS